MGADSNPTGFNSAAIIALDLGNDGILDFYIGVQVNGVNGNINHDVGIYQFTGLATNPSNTQSALASPSDPLVSYEGRYDWSPVSSIDPDAPADLDGLGDDDYFLSFSVDFMDLVTAIDGTGWTDSEGNGLSASTPLSFVAITSQNLNQINNDFNGIEGTDTNSTTPWTDLGGTSEEYSPESEEPLGAVPEPPSYGIILGVLCLLFAVFSRRILGR